MERTNFQIIFKKLAEENQSLTQESLVSTIDAMRDELDEISELRRLSAELSDPAPVSYTLT